METPNKETPDFTTADHPTQPRARKTPALSNKAGSTANTYEVHIYPVACWKTEDTCFDFNSFFVNSNSWKSFSGFKTQREYLLRRISKVYGDHPLLALFGHADPVGKDLDNKALSEKRAQSIFGVLTKRVSIWKKLFATPASIKALQDRLKQYGCYTGAINGLFDSDTETAVAAYMEKICPGLKLTDSDFVDKGAKACQGCSELNPLRMFSKEEWQDLNLPKNHKERDSRNAMNRRAMGFYFRPIPQSLLREWPCKAHPDIGACYAQRFPDDKNRAAYQPGKSRLYPAPPKDTFRCQFYGQLAESSPCEKGVAQEKQKWQIEIMGYEDGGYSHVNHKDFTFQICLEFLYYFKITAELERIDGKWWCLQAVFDAAHLGLNPVVNPANTVVLKTVCKAQKTVNDLKGKEIDIDIRANNEEHYDLVLDGPNKNYFLSNPKGALCMSFLWPQMRVPIGTVHSRVRTGLDKDYYGEEYDVEKKKTIRVKYSLKGISINEFESDNWFSRARDSGGSGVTGWEHRLPIADSTAKILVRPGPQYPYWLEHHYVVKRIG
ncbi:MAG: hypothetical protein H6Q55_464 [Deltaproteobacteria bacterium]|nr:hypothetical protein [Deltaproteobacteria bacterium]